MGKNYKILINPAPPDPKQIEASKDFDALLQLHQEKLPKQPQRRSARLIYLGSAIAASIIFAIAYIFLNQGSTERYHQEATAYFASQPLVNPPLKEVKLSTEKLNVIAEKGDTLIFQSGSRVIIPSLAFVNKNGESIKGNVQIEFIEMLDFVDFFISGIPMSYDSNGVQYQLESAGMVEIRGLQNGQPVNLAPGKQLAVELKSTLQLPRVNVAPPKFNVYRLDQDERAWNYEGKDQIEVLSERSETPKDELYQLREALNEELLAIDRNRALAFQQLDRQVSLPIKPVQPIAQEEDGQRTTIRLDDFLSIATVSESAQQKINSLKELEEQIIVEIAPNSSPFTPEFSAIDRADISLESDNLFSVTLFKDSKELLLKLRPVISKQNYAIALEDYNQKLAQYQLALTNRRNLLANKQDSLNQVFDLSIQAAKQSFETSLNDLIQSGKIDAEARAGFDIVNRFTINAFGIWNCDRPILRDGQSVNVKLVDQNGKKIVNQTAFLVNKSTNTIYHYLASNKTPIQYSENAEFLIWVISEQNKLAVLNSKNADISKNKNELILKLKDKSLSSEQDVRSVLYF